MIRRGGALTVCADMTKARKANLYSDLRSLGWPVGGRPGLSRFRNISVGRPPGRGFNDLSRSDFRGAVLRDVSRACPVHRPARAVPGAFRSVTGCFDDPR